MHFLGIYALHRDEMKLKLQRGARPLADVMERGEVTEVVQPGRPSAVRKKRFGLF